MEVVHADHVTGLVDVMHWRGAREGEDQPAGGGLWWRERLDVVKGCLLVSLGFPPSNVNDVMGWGLMGM